MDGERTDFTDLGAAPNVPTAAALRARARYLLAGAGRGAAGYGTYLLGLMLQTVVVVAMALVSIALFVMLVGVAGALAADAPVGAASLGNALDALRVVETLPPATLILALGGSAAVVLGLLYTVAFASWSQAAMPLALARGGLTMTHGVSGFGNGWRMAGLILWQQTFVFLWMLLLIVPGIRALFSYALAPYLLVDHPDWTARQCLAESKRLMDGNRWRLFELNLSFWGWWLLVLLAHCTGFGGLANLLFTPYVDTARAAFYEDLLDRMSLETT